VIIGEWESIETNGVLNSAQGKATGKEKDEQVAVHPTDTIRNVIVVFQVRQAWLDFSNVKPNERRILVRTVYQGHEPGTKTGERTCHRRAI